MTYTTPLLIHIVLSNGVTYKAGNLAHSNKSKIRAFQPHRYFSAEKLMEYRRDGDATVTVTQPWLQVIWHTLEKLGGVWGQDWQSTRLQFTEVMSGTALQYMCGEPQHRIYWESSRVQMTAHTCWNRRAIEAIHIRSDHRTMDLDYSFHISYVWNPLLDATETDCLTNQSTILTY